MHTAQANHVAFSLVQRGKPIHIPYKDQEGNA
jgi:hypothetical protein